MPEPTVTSRPRTPPAVRRANSGDLPLLAELFDGYRRFYGQPSDIPRASAFLRERMERADSIPLVGELADRPGALAGFTQLYPSFSSVRCRRILILNDLFVADWARGRGVGDALMSAARAVAVADDAAYVTLTTGHANAAARRLYERSGYTVDDEFATYVLDLSS